MLMGRFSSNRELKWNLSGKEAPAKYRELCSPQLHSESLSERLPWSAILWGEEGNPASFHSSPGKGPWTHQLGLGRTLWAQGSRSNSREPRGGDPENLSVSESWPHHSALAQARSTWVFASPGVHPQHCKRKYFEITFKGPERWLNAKSTCYSWRESRFDSQLPHCTSSFNASSTCNWYPLLPSIDTFRHVVCSQTSRHTHVSINTKF